MAKKDKKGKQKRHQIKKSRQGQVSKQRPKADIIELPEPVLEQTDDDTPTLPASFIDGLFEEPPLVENGYRIVGPAQAMVDFAKPLIDNAKSKEDLSESLSMVQAIWNLSLLKSSDPKAFLKGKKELIDKLGSEDIIDKMITRRETMFPYVGKVPAFYFRERVIDIEKYETFDETTLNISKDKIPPTKKELALAGRLKKIAYSEDEEKLFEWRNDVLDCYIEWCIAKGMQENKAGQITYIAGTYLDFLKDHYGKVVLANTPVKVLQWFMQSYFIRKTSMPAWQKSMMPAALKLFMQYLDEKGIVTGTGRVIKIIKSQQDIFQNNLRLFTDPSLA